MEGVSVMMRWVKLGIGLLSFLLSSLAYAIAPVVDAYNEENVDSASVSSQNSVNSGSDRLPSFTPGQRLSILEHKVDNLNPLLIKIDDFQQRLQSLQGQVEGQQHEIEQLKKQLANHRYQVVEKYSAQDKTAHIVNKNDTPVSSRLTNLVPAKDLQKIPTHKNPSMVPISSTTSAAEQRYQAGFQFLKDKQYAAATKEFDDFIKEYPHDIHVSNADYFLGQLYLLQGQPEQSIIRFKDFINKGGQDARVPDALLQLGLAYFAKGDKQTAMDTFKKIIQQYPDSKAAESAQARLQQFGAMISAANLSVENTS